jgi:putative ABC transport system permease protein
MNTVSLALRNLLRNRRRSLATLLAMVLGLVAILLFGGYRSNILYGMQTGFVQYSGHLQVQHRGWFDDGGDNPAAHGIADHARIAEAIRHDPVLAPMLAVVTPTLQLGGVAGNFAAGLSRSVVATGLVAADQERLRQWNEHGMVSYAQPLALEGTAPDAVVVGTGVARRLRLCSVPGAPACRTAPAPRAASAGDAPADIAALSALQAPAAPAAQSSRIELLASGESGAPNVASLEVVRANNLGVKAIDDVFLAMHLPLAQRLVQGEDGSGATAIVVQLRRTAQLPAARARLEALLAERFGGQALQVLDYASLNPIYVQTDEFMVSMFGFIALLIGVIVLFTIGNTMSAAVMERTTEIGTLRAMGLRRAGIRRLFLAEALLLGGAGSALGLGLALALAAAINHSGWSWTPPGYAYAYLVQVRVGEDAALLAGCISGLLAVTAASAWWPARRAASMNVVEALRHA